MNTLISSFVKRNFSPTKILMTAGVALLLAGLSGCGGNNVDYNKYCEAERECLGQDNFNQQYGSIGECADDLRSEVDSLSGDCKNSYTSWLSCQANNGGTCNTSTACTEQAFEVASNCGAFSL